MADVKVISDTIQEFNGDRYYLCGYYYQHKGKRLHRAVWEYYNGEIPEGYHVHHIDEDRSNNAIENLALMPGIEHMKMHGQEEQRREHGRQVIKIAIEVAPEWHRSEAGREWHSQHIQERWEKMEPYVRTCSWCGKEYETRDMGHKGNHFCSGRCKAAFRRDRLRKEEHDED